MESVNKPTIDAALLCRLLRASEPITVSQLCTESEQAASLISNQLRRLTAAGCDVQCNPTGVVLRSSGLGTWADYLQWATDLSRIVLVYRQTSSTQDLARQLLESHGHRAHGAVAVADEQTAGRGRMGRQWIAPPGTAVTFSLAWIGPRSDSVATLDRLLLATVVAVADTLAHFTKSQTLDVRIRWPNDVLLEGCKVAGLLVETFIPRGASDLIAAVIGVGINVSLSAEQVEACGPKFQHGATSLALCGCHADRLLVLAESVRRMDEALAQQDPGPLLAQWRQRSTIMSKRVTLRHDGQILHGQVIDLDPDDGLIVRTDAGSITHLPAETTSIL